MGVMGLRNRIMLLVALGVLIATAPLGVMGLGMARAATDRVLEERLAMTRATAEHINERLVQGWGQLNQLSARVALHLSEADPRVIRQEFAVSYPQMPLFSGGIVYLDREARTVVAQPADRPPAVPFARDPIITQVLASGSPQTSSIVLGAGRTPMVFFAVPVFRAPGRVAGAVVGMIDLSKPTLLTFITGLAMGSSGHAAIVGRDGFVLASTDTGELFSRNEHPEFFARFIAEGRALVGPTVEDHGPDVRGARHIMAFAPISSVPWGLGIGQTEEETFGPIRRLRDRILLFELVVLAAALLFAWLDTGAVAAPLRLLQHAAERIAGGDLAQRIAVRRGDEIGTLAQSFETMRVRLLRSLEENARLQERLRSVAMLDERERIAREMHDSVGQVLGYVNTKAQAVQALLERGQIQDAEAQLGELEQAARSVYADLREAILSLRTTTGPEHRLVPALSEYVRRFTELSGVETTLTVQGGTFEFAPTVEVHLIRIVQEALTNVRKHAAAHRAVVRFTMTDGAALVTVEDDGVGMGDGGAHPASGFGLQTMRERAEAIGGVMTVRTGAAGGTVVEIALPKAGEDSHARLAG